MSHSLTSADALRLAQIQIATEAFFSAEGTPEDLSRQLRAGNHHASLFTQTQAKDFAEHWVVVDQRENSNTDFSGTLLSNRETNELVISFRSTKFADDAVRDNQATTCVTPVGCHA